MPAALLVFFQRVCFCNTFRRCGIDEYVSFDKFLDIAVACRRESRHRKSEFEMNCAPRVLNLTSEMISSPWRRVSFYDVASRFHTSRVLSLCVNRVLS